MEKYYRIISSDELYHHGIKGQKWGIRLFQNENGSLTAEGRERYGVAEDSEEYKYNKPGESGWKGAARALKANINKRQKENRLKNIQNGKEIKDNTFISKKTAIPYEMMKASQKIGHVKIFSYLLADGFNKNNVAVKFKEDSNFIPVSKIINRASAIANATIFANSILKGYKNRKAIEAYENASKDERKKAAEAAKVSKRRSR